MKRVLVIADDLSGAAEIAGIAKRFGLPTNLFRKPIREGEAPAEPVWVFDTDSRSLPPAEAARRVREFVDPLRNLSFDLIFKKTDSVLRGPVRAEIEAVMTGLKRNAAIFVPQNPSRGRVIDPSGAYRIDGVPLAETSFRNDPEYPAKTSNARELLKEGNAPIELPSATTTQEIETIASRADAKTAILAGAADFFTALCGTGVSPVNDSKTCARRPCHQELPILWVCGSNSGYAKELVQIAVRAGIAISSMPDDVFDGGAVTTWANGIISRLRATSRVLVNIQRPSAEGNAESLRQSLAALAAAVLAKQPVQTLCLEGGATASAVCEKLGWHSVEVVSELAPGIVALKPQRPDAPQVLIKPGSYRWPDELFTLPASA